MFDGIRHISPKTIQLKVSPSKQRHSIHPQRNIDMLSGFYWMPREDNAANWKQNIYGPADCTAQVMSYRKLWSMGHCGRGSHSVGWLRPINQSCYDHNRRQLHCARQKSADNSCALFSLKFQSTVRRCSYYSISFLYNAHDRYITVTS